MDVESGRAAQRGSCSGRPIAQHGLTDTFDQYVQVMPSGCHEWTGFRTVYGYGRYRRKQAHRVAYTRSIGPIPTGLCICHRCDNRACVNPDHLFLGTHVDNMRDKTLKDRVHRGEDSDRAKLTEDDVRRLRKLAQSGWSEPRLASEFGISKGQARRISKREQWAHVK